MNAVIYRLPRNISLVSSRSHCTNCNKLIYWYENIPVISYIFLKGKCSHCKSSISVLYPLVEIVVGIFAVLITPEFLSKVTIVNYLFQLSVFSVFVAIFIIDVQHKIIPNELNIYLALIFLMATVLSKPLLFWLLGGALGVAIPWGITYIFYLLKGKIGLGGGDIKLFGALGIFLGPMGFLSNLTISCFIGSVVMILLILLKITKKDSYVPFGPFIVITAFFQIYFPSYFNMLMNALFI